MAAASRQRLHRQAPNHVQLSDLSAHLTAALGGSAAHLKKISTLAAALLKGGYHVDTLVVSDSIIRHSLQFGGANYL
jgi:anti-sigma28 factor (negative regulator of flagellin synthesis)